VPDPPSFIQGTRPRPKQWPPCCVTPPADSVVRAQVGVGRGVPGHGRPGVDGAAGGVPVRRRRAEEAPGGHGHGGGVAPHEVHFGLVAVVGLHVGHLRLVLDHPPAAAPLRRVVVVGLRDALEVELVGVALAVHLGHDVLVVVVAQRAAQLVVVHVGLALALAPALGHLVRVRHLELAVGSLPRDDAGVVAVGQQLQQELPQLDLTRAWRGKGGGGRLRNLWRLHRSH